MKKQFLFLLLGSLLVSCDGNNTNNETDEILPKPIPITDYNEDFDGLIYEPGSKYGFTYTFDGRYDEYSENLPFNVSTEGFTGENNYLVATYSDDINNNDESFMDLFLNDFYPNAIMENGYVEEFVEGDIKCAIKPETITIYMSYMPTEFLADIKVTCSGFQDIIYKDTMPEDYDYNLNAYVIDVSSLTKDYSFDDYCEFYLSFYMLTTHCLVWPEIPLQTFGVEISGELIAR